MTALAAIIRRAILEEPDVDLHRLALADILMESEDERERAEGEFIAASMAFVSRTDSPCYLYGKSRRGICGSCDWCEAWLSLCTGYSALSEPADILLGPGEVLPTPSVFGYWRGLPHTWAVADVPTFEHEAKDVFSRHPIDRVVLRCEAFSRNIWLWYRRQEWNTESDDCSDSRIFRLLSGRVDAEAKNCKRYRSVGEARADIERCCVIYGREIAGLKREVPVDGREVEASS